VSLPPHCPVARPKSDNPSTKSTAAAKLNVEEIVVAVQQMIARFLGLQDRILNVEIGQDGSKIRDFMLFEDKEMG